MKEKKNLFEKFLKKIAQNALKHDANCTTCGVIYQPKVPAELKKFSKIGKE